MSYGGQSNQPWQRNIMPFQNVAPQQMYMNTSGFQHASQMQSSGQMYGNNEAYPQTYNSIGTVTKINNECGLVNDEVFFYRNVCKGAVPKLGDRVLFEATLSTTGQFKWNATRIQSMAPQPLMSTAIGGGVVDHKASSRYGNVPPADYRSGNHSSPAGRDRAFRGDRPERRERDSEREHLRRSREREDAERDRKRRREDVDRSREVERAERGNASRASNAARNTREEVRRDRDHSNERKERERKERIREREHEHERERERDREKERNVSPKARSVRALRRYKVQIPKHTLVCHELSIPDIRQRYPSLYIPSLFFHADVCWPQTFTFEKPFSLRRACQFLIMHESVESLTPFKKEELEPTDCDYSYSAKVILLECPSLADIYQKCSKDDGEENPMHLLRLIRCLFGTRGDNSPMAIGGYWSPTLDGPNPGKDPAVLIRTAIRTCKALTGIDLSNCTQWYRICEYHYENERNSSEPARVETVVMFLPDVHSCMPTVEEWQKLTSDYKSAAENIIAQREQLVAAANTCGLKTASNNDADAETETDAMDTTNDENAETVADETKAGDDKQQEDNTNTNTTGEDNKDASTPIKQQAALDKSTDGDDIENEKDNDKSEPTHYSKLDLKTMKVQEMRDELIARSLPAKGVRTVIMARLAKALNAEKADEIKASKEARYKSKTVVKKDETEAKKPEPKKIKDDDNVDDNDDDDDDDDDDVQIISDDNELQNGKDNVKAQKDKTDNESEEKLANKSKAELTEKKNEENEEQEEWGAGMDVDMNDIVILDEYDSRKNPEDVQLKEFTEKDKERIIRRYTLPSTPHIIVHPNRAAKSGKFDCMTTSLSNLLEYGPGNSKQRFFEIALFAELFRDLLMRDFSFNIYKEIYIHNQNNANQQEQQEAESKENNSANKHDKNAQKNEEKEKSSKENNVDGKSEDVQSAKATTNNNNKRKANAAANDEKEKEKEKEAAVDQKNLVTVKPHLLLSFLFFDSTHCGYIYKRDLEEMFYLCGLSLSRAQIQALLDKLSKSHAFPYHTITDEELVPDVAPAIKDIDDLDEETFKKIAGGNFALFEDGNEEGENENDEAIVPTETEDGLITYNGTVVHVGKLIDQIKRTEKSLSDMEKLYNDIRGEHSELQKTYTRTNNKMKDLQSEVKNLSHKLGDTNRDLNSINRKYREEHSILTLVYNRLTPFVGRDKEKDHKSESSEKDKSRTKDKEEAKKGNEKDKKSKNKSKDTKDEKKNEEEKEKEAPKSETDTKTENNEDHTTENHDENSKSGDASNNGEQNEDEAINEEAKEED